jgi:hypothetical protein
MNSEESDYKSDTMSLIEPGHVPGPDHGEHWLFARLGHRRQSAATQPSAGHRRSYRVGLSQVLTRSMLLSLNFESNTQQGYLHSAYRSMRFNTPGNSYGYGPEIYPETRTGNAGAARLKYFLPWKAAVEGGYRFYSDTWGIMAHTASVEYTQPMWGKWVFSGSYRFYSQTGADFYSDLFPNANYQNFMGATRKPPRSPTIPLAWARYEFPVTWLSFLKKGTVNFNYNYMMFDYKDFRDLTDFPPGTATPGTEPLYSMNASIYQLCISSICSSLTRGGQCPSK